MIRFKKYINKDIRLENVKNSAQLSTYGVICKHLPDPIEEFDEFEFNIDFYDQKILLGVAVLEGKVKRVMFVMVDQEDSDVFRPLTESQLKGLLDLKGEQLVSFFEFITK